MNTTCPASSHLQSVLHIFNGLNPSGMERMLLSASPHSPISNNHITVVGQGKTNPFAQELRKAGYNVELIRSISSPAGFISLVRLIRMLRPSVIHIHTEGKFAQAVLAARAASASTPLVRSVHSIFKKKRLAAVYRRLVSALLDREVSKFVACSPEVQDFEEAFGRTTDLVWNWVDDKFFSLERSVESSSFGDRRNFLLVGNCSWIKNHELALEALDHAAFDSSFDFAVAHYGLEHGGSAEERVKLDKWEDEGRLTHRGPGDPSNGMTNRPTFLMPSLHEGMGVALAEAIVAGLPAIVADVPGLQWAREFNNVSHAKLTVADWAQELVNFEPGKDSENADKSRFSARIGINSYFEIYASAIERSRRSKSRLSGQSLIPGKKAE